MAHARIATYRTATGSFDALAKRASGPGGMLEIYQAAAGLVAYGLVRTGDDSLVSLSIWDSEAEAEAAVRLAAVWVQDHIADSVTLISNQVGDFDFLAGNLVAAAG